MKKFLLILFPILLFGEISFCQGTWTQKSNVGGMTRWGAIGFSIGSKGYIGLGETPTSDPNDFWEYDPSSDTWTQKANFTGEARKRAVAFTIGNKGYVTTGDTGAFSNIVTNDLWEYDVVLNTWMQKTSFGGVPRFGAVGLAIGNKGYVGTGQDISNLYNDFWEYDPSLDSWTQKTNFGGGMRIGATGFSIGNKGYIGLGSDQSTYQNDLWEYDPSVDMWTQKANFPGNARLDALEFSISGYGFVGGGWGMALTSFMDFWEYNPSLNSWVQRMDFPDSSATATVSFSIGGKGYVGTGWNWSFGSITNKFWEYTPDSTLSITEPQTQTTISIYPNPMTESATLKIADGGLSISDLTIELYDLRGKCVRKSAIANPQFEIVRNGLPSGAYLYKVSSETATLASGKLVIQ